MERMPESQSPSTTPQPTEQPRSPPATTVSSSLPLPTSSLPPTSLPSSSTTPATIASPSSTNPSTTTAPPQTTSQILQSRQPLNNRPWQQPSASPSPSPFQHFSLPSPPPPPPPHSSSSPSSSADPLPRGGMAIGVPSPRPGPPQPPTSFSSLTQPSFGHQIGGLRRNVADSVSSSSTAEVRRSITGMMGLGSSSQLKPSGIPGQQLRPVQSSLRPHTSPSTQSTTNLQGHNITRSSSVGSPGSPSPGISQSPQTHNQPWLSSGPQAKPPLPPSSLRPQASPHSLQQRSHITQQHTSSVQQYQPSVSNQSQEQFGRIQQSLPYQSQITKGQGLGIQRPPSHPTVLPNEVQPGPSNRVTGTDTEESCNRILSKRSIQELVAQIDPSEKLDSEVEDILVDIAEDFVESITTFGCSLAKHRKSSTLEAKDILLHLERNWNISLPGFGGDEIRPYKKPVSSDNHKERLALVKRSMAAAEMTTRSLAGHGGGNAKGHLAKGPANVFGSPSTKIREAA